MIIMERIASKTYLIQNCLMGRKFDKLMIGGKNGKHMVNKRKKDNNRTILIFVLIAVFFLCACHSNQIWFDCQTNTVYSVEDYPIRELNVTMVNAKKSFWISKIDTLKGESCIKLDSLGKSYKIVEDSVRLLPLKKYDNIPFVPFETYEIYHASIGDASACIIYVQTDENGKANKVLKQ
jgi:hypothetical protein